MIQVQRSESGQYVLIHPSSSTVVVSDDLAAGFAAISEKVRGAREAPAAAAEAPSRWRALLPWGLAIGLPFVWLLALHLSLGRLASELVIGMRAPPTKAQPVTRKELDDLRLEVARVEARIKEPARPQASAPDEPDDGDDDDDLKSLRPEKARPAAPEAAGEPAKVEPPGKRTELKAEAKSAVEPRK